MLTGSLRTSLWSGTSAKAFVTKHGQFQRYSSFCNSIHGLRLSFSRKSYTKPSVGVARLDLIDKMAFRAFRGGKIPQPKISTLTLDKSHQIDWEAPVVI